MEVSKHMWKSSGGGGGGGRGGGSSGNRLPNSWSAGGIQGLVLEAMLVLAVPLLLVEPALGVEMIRALVEEVDAELKCCVLLIVGALVIWVFAAMLFGVQSDNKPKLPSLFA